MICQFKKIYVTFMVIYFIGYTPHTVYETMTVCWYRYIALTLVVRARSLAPHWRSNVEAEWDGTSITRGGESRAGDDFSSAERCAKSR